MNQDDPSLLALKRVVGEISRKIGETIFLLLIKCKDFAVAIDSAKIGLYIGLFELMNSAFSQAEFFAQTLELYLSNQLWLVR